GLVEPHDRFDVLGARGAGNPDGSLCIQVRQVSEDLPQVVMVRGLELVLDDDEVGVLIFSNNIDLKRTSRNISPRFLQGESEHLGQGVQIVDQPRGEAALYVAPELAEVDLFQLADGHVRRRPIYCERLPRHTATLPPETGPTGATGARPLVCAR